MVDKQVSKKGGVTGEQCHSEPWRWTRLPPPSLSHSRATAKAEGISGLVLGDRSSLTLGWLLLLQVRPLLEPSPRELLQGQCLGSEQSRSFFAAVESRSSFCVHRPGRGRGSFCGHRSLGQPSRPISPWTPWSKRGIDGVSRCPTVTVMHHDQQPWLLLPRKPWESDSDLTNDH